MNYVINDRGQPVIAVGAPGSVERVTVERPELLERLNKLRIQAYGSPGHGLDAAIELIRAVGVRSEMETSALVQASNYKNKEDSNEQKA